MNEEPKRRGRRPKSMLEPAQPEVQEEWFQPDEELSDQPEPQPESAHRSGPMKIKMRRPFGYIDDGGSHRHWMIHQVISAPNEIDDIMERGFTDFTVLE